MKKILLISISASLVASLSFAQTKVTKVVHHKIKPGITIVKGSKKPIIINHRKK